MQDASRRSFDAVLVYKLDRFGRACAIALMVSRRLRRKCPSKAHTRSRRAARTRELRQQRLRAGSRHPLRFRVALCGRKRVLDEAVPLRISEKELKQRTPRARQDNRLRLVD